MINTFYHKGKSAVGTPIKMSLLQMWYGLSDYEVEDRVNDSISFSRFCNLNLEQNFLDHRTLSRFRNHMTSSGSYIGGIDN